MQYRKFGKTNEQVSLLGFGCMRLPVIGGDASQIDDEKAIAMVRHAIDAGVNYIDTAYPYHGKGFGKGGASEPFVARALKDGYREKVNIATKLPSWLCESQADMERLLDEQLSRLETQTIDFYLVHALNKTTWDKLKTLDIGAFLDRAIAAGKIRYAGFSFHDNEDCFIDIVDSYDWSFCQIQYNYLDENYQAGKKGLEYASDKGLGIAIMEPLRGGSLAQQMPAEIEAAWEKAPVKRTPVEWALRWVMNHPEVSVVLSGMSEMVHVEENLKTASEGAANSLTQEEIGLVDYAKEVFNSRMKINCTGCRYCMPCPVGVDIPQNFGLYNNAYLFDSMAVFQTRYRMFLPDASKATQCIECGKCESHCPQNIAIREELKNVARVLG